MSSWFKDRRQEFIDATFRQFGQVRRADIVREFDVTVQVASSDIATYLETRQNIRYDVSAKTYVVDDQPLNQTPMA